MKAVTVASGLFLLPAHSLGAGKVHELRSHPCDVSRFALAVGPEISEPTGQHTLSVRLTNRGRRTCILDGYPRIWLSDRTGMIPFAITHRGDQVVTADRPRRVVVKPGGAAFVVLNHYRCDVGVVRAATRVRLAAPGATRAASGTLDIRGRYERVDYCGKGQPGSVLAVSPFVSSLGAGLRRH
jgi:hypothetical protein